MSKIRMEIINFKFYYFYYYCFYQYSLFKSSVGFLKEFKYLDIGTSVNICSRYLQLNIISPTNFSIFH